MLAGREHSRRELARKLEHRGYARDAVERVLDELDAGRLLSDERFTEAYVRHRAAAGYGPLRIERELQQRGVDAALIASGLELYAGQWPERAAAARHKRFGGSLPQGFRERARQARFLEYRGFAAEHIRSVLPDD